MIELVRGVTTMQEKKSGVRTIYDSLYKHRKFIGSLIITLLVFTNILLFIHILPILEPIR